MTDFALARRNMVESQIRTNDVTDRRLIAALLEVPRERFVPAAMRGLAYIDEDILLDADRAPLAHGADAVCTPRPACRDRYG